MTESLFMSLLELRNQGPLDDFRAAMFLGKSRRQTLKALERRGWARYFPTPEHWKITSEGRTVLKVGFAGFKKRELAGLEWRCGSCGVTFGVYKPSKLGDSGPCTECDGGVTEVKGVVS
jgi:hypothetical protein